MKRKLKLKSLFALLLAAILLTSTFASASVQAKETDSIVYQENDANTETSGDENFIDETDTTEQDAPIVQNTVQFSTLNARAFEMVDIYYTIDGATKVSAQMPSGLVKDHMNEITDLVLPDNVRLEKAYVLHTDGSTTDIERIGNLDGKTYYSIADDQDTGILLKTAEEIILQIKTVYQVKYIYDSTHGTIIGKAEVFKGDNLLIQTKAADYYHPNSAMYSVNDTVAYMNLDEHGYATVPASAIVGDVTIIVDFAKDAPYTFEMETDAILHGFLCAESSVAAGTNQAVINHNKFTFGPDGTATAILYSQNWSGGDEWILNKITLNGEDVRIPFGYDKNNVGEVMRTTMKDGTKVTVRFEAYNVSDPHTSSGTKRNKYSIVVEGAKGNLKIGGNFKEYDPREIIVKDMSGIKKIASSDEYIHWKTVPIGWNYKYTLFEADSLVFPTYNEGKTDSRHIYVYDVLPGFNPYKVNVDVYYDGVLARQFDENFPIGTDPSKIADQYTTKYRDWDSFKNDVVAKDYPYAFALLQNKCHNQMMHISAEVYAYQVEYDLDGGTFANEALDKTKYTISTDKQTVTEKQTYSIDKGAVSTNMPMAVPAKDGYVFVGWKLVKEDTTVYSQNQQFVIDENSVQYAQGDEKKNDGLKFVFKAVWEDASTSDKVPYTISYYKESANGTIINDGKTYELMYEANKVGVRGAEVVVIDDHNPGDAYKLNDAISKVKIDSLEYGVDDEIYFYYDLYTATHDLQISKTVAGKFGDQTKEFTINLTMKDSKNVGTEGSFFYEGFGVGGVDAPTDDVVTFVDGKASITLKGGQYIKLKEIPEGYTYTVTEADYTALGYVTTYEGHGASDAGVIYTMAQEDEVVSITNTKDATTEPETGVRDNVTSVATGVGVVSVIGLMGCLLFVRRRRSIK